MATAEPTTDVLIVGAGPIGIELAVACKRAGLTHRILEAGPIGHTISWWAPQTRWFSSPERIAIAGVPLLTPDQSKATRETYLTYLRGIVQQFQLDVHCFERVIDVQGERGQFTVQTDRHGVTRSHQCRHVVLAVGGTDRPNMLDIPGENLPHVDGYLRDPHRYFGRRVLIIGGRNSAVEAALRLHNAGARVALSYRQPELPEQSIKYWLLPEIKSLLKSGRIQSLLGTQPVRITPDHVCLQSTSVEQTQSTIEIPTDDVLKLIGYQQDKSLFRAAGVDLLDTPQRPACDPITKESNVPGLYIAGTAVAGTQSSRYKTFLENCHEHVDQIIAHITGREQTARAAPYATQIELQPES